MINPVHLFGFATISFNAGQIVSKLHVIELGSNSRELGFTEKQADLFFSPDFTDDFPAAMQISHEYDFTHLFGQNIKRLEGSHGGTMST